VMPFLDRSNLNDVELAAGRPGWWSLLRHPADPSLISLVHAGGALAGG
jgi:hypothetical protein